MCPQVILTEVPWDEPAAAAAPAVSDAPAGSQSTWTVVPGSSGGRVVQPPPNSPARLFWEYLSYLFRRPEPLSEQEQLEMNYRDFLQVLKGLWRSASAVSRCMCFSLPPGCRAHVILLGMSAAF